MPSDELVGKHSGNLVGDALPLSDPTKERCRSPPFCATHPSPLLPHVGKSQMCSQRQSGVAVVGVRKEDGKTGWGGQLCILGELAYWHILFGRILSYVVIHGCRVEAENCELSIKEQRHHTCVAIDERMKKV